MKILWFLSSLLISTSAFASANHFQFDCSDGNVIESFGIEHQINYPDQGLQQIVRYDVTTASLSWDAAAGDYIAEATYKNLVMKDVVTNPNTGDLEGMTFTQTSTPTHFYLKLHKNNAGSYSGFARVKENDKDSQGFEFKGRVTCSLKFL
jgi:hypothetical protein